MTYPRVLHKPTDPRRLMEASEWATRMRRNMDPSLEQSVRDTIMRSALQDLAVMEYATRFWRAALTLCSRSCARARARDIAQWKPGQYRDLVRELRRNLHKLNQITQRRLDLRPMLDRAARYYRLHYRLCAGYDPSDAESNRTVMVELAMLNTTWWMKA